MRKQRWKLLLVLMTALAMLPFGLVAAAAESSPVHVAGLTTEHATDPLGIDVATPRLSWIDTSNQNGVSQTAYQIVVSTSGVRAANGIGDVWDTGKVTSSQSDDVNYAGKPLQSRTRYFWAVRVWDDNGQASPWSQTGWFETAFLNPANFQGNWIGRTADASTSTPNPLLRKEFSLHDGITSARAYISGLGFYQLYINGKRIGDNVLDPAFTLYNKTVDYVTYDVTQQLQSGANAVGVSLGNGWYSGNGNPHFTNPATIPWQPAQPKAKVELDVRYADGTSAQVLSDPSWVTADGPTTADNVQSETYDARLAEPGWAQPGFNASSWTPAVQVTAPAGQLRAQSIPPIKETATIKPAAVTQPQPGVKVYDFGITTSGWARIMMQGTAGTSVRISYSEKLNSDGTAASEAGQTDTYIMKGGGAETYEPSWGWKGYRYVQVSTNPATPGAAPPPLPNILSVQGVEVHTALSSTGDFQSSSSLFNTMHNAMRQTILNNQQSYGTDTPVYEKGGWTADNRLYSESAISNFGAEAYYENWMQDFNDQQAADGSLPVIVPSPTSGPRTDPVWESAIIIMHWYLYRYYGDTSAISRDYGAMAAWLDNLAAQIEPTGYIYQGNTFGDWSVPTNANPPSSQMLGSMFLYESAAELSQMAAVIGNTAGASKYDALAANIRSAINDQFYDATSHEYRDPLGLVSHASGGPNGVITSTAYDQSANALGLAFGLAPVADRQAVAQNLASDVVSKGNLLATGAGGSRWILPMLTEAGYGDLAYQVATNPNYPGWANWFEQCGATTMWEGWGCNPRSHDHAFMGTIDDWFFTDVAGIESPTDPVGTATTGPGFRTIVIKPYPVGSLTSASANQATPLGSVSSSWTRSNNHFDLKVEIPVGATAQILVPATDQAAVNAQAGATFKGMQGSYAMYSVGSGTYNFDSVM
jgi:alpha-L-rhamnosidase